MSVLAPYRYFCNAVRGGFASFARLYRYFSDAIKKGLIELLGAVRYIIATFPTR